MKREGWTVENPSLANNTGFGVMDDLVYSYDNGNKLTNVADNNASDTYGFKDVNGSGTEYQYDDNGNMISDANKNITGILYNHLNLPVEVKFENNNNRRVAYVYDATGAKLKKSVYDNSSTPTTVTDYASGYVYENNVLQFFNHPEEYVEKDGSNFNYVYQYKDHLGNVRLTYADSDGNGSIDPSTEIISERSYYPFGLEHRGYNTVVSANANSAAMKYGYNGKELQDDNIGGNRLDWHDFGARNYDASLGRWMNVDPLADLRYELTPYNYVQNSPIFRFDPDGLTDYTFNKRTGEVTAVEGTETDDGIDRIVKTRRNGEIRRRRNGEARVEIDNIEQGILNDGINLRTNDNIIEVGEEGQATVDGVKSFTLRLSEYIRKEIKGFSYSSDGSGDVSDVLLGGYEGNTYTTSSANISELRRRYRNNYSNDNIVQQFHTHPDGKLGATQSAPHISADVRNLQSQRPMILNATFIVIYRLNRGLEEYDYTHEYRPQRN